MQTISKLVTLIPGQSQAIFTALFGLLISAIATAALADNPKSELPAPTSTPTAPANAYRILFIGNSISRHGFNADTIARLKWDHVAGMAASDESKDYAHLLAAKINGALQGRAVTLQFVGLVSGGEGTPAERLAPVLQGSAGYNPDLVIFQHGEHEKEVHGAAAVAATYNAVLDFMQGLASHPKIVCVGNWNPDPLAKTAYSGWCGVLEQTMRDICTARHLPFVSVVKIAQDPACHGAGQNPGVQWHPNDEGHARYANVIFETVRPLLPAAVP